MQITILTIGKNMPTWVKEAYHDYEKRFPHEIKPQLIVVPLAPRKKNTNIQQYLQQEAEKLKKYIAKSDYAIALAIQGHTWSTEELALQLQDWQSQQLRVNLIIGGPDGLDSEILQGAQLQWSLSDLTLPHPIVRVMLIEQLYRALSIIKQHPYHRG